MARVRLTKRDSVVKGGKNSDIVTNSGKYKSSPKVAFYFIVYNLLIYAFVLMHPITERKRKLTLKNLTFVRANRLYTVRWSFKGNFLLPQVEYSQIQT